MLQMFYSNRIVGSKIDEDEIRPCTARVKTCMYCRLGAKLRSRMEQKHNLPSLLFAAVVDSTRWSMTAPKTRKKPISKIFHFCSN